MTRLEKGIFNRGRVCGIADCMKHLALERSGCLEEVAVALADEMCVAADDLFALLGGEAACKPASQATGGILHTEEHAEYKTGGEDTSKPASQALDYSDCKSPAEAISKLLKESGRSEAALYKKAKIAPKTWIILRKNSCGVQEVTKKKLRDAFGFPDRIYDALPALKSKGKKPKAEKAATPAMSSDAAPADQGDGGDDDYWIKQLRENNKDRQAAATGRD